jgi:putative photosynthetic complex assembly protein
MSQPKAVSHFPRSALYGALAVVLGSIGLAAAGRLTGAANSTPDSAPVLSRDLFFRDRADGGVVVVDARNPAVPIGIMAPETNGFLRATMRGLARQRIRQAEGAEQPFRLTEWADGRLTLEDPVTARRVEMEAFGITNEEVFARLLTAKEATP